jgi:glycosyltransferase involved in cell wall biosynthesis
MFLLESMAAGVPVVQPRRGAFTEVVERTAGGLLVAPDDVEALAEGLQRLWSDHALSGKLADNAFDGVRAHYTVEQSAIRQVAVYELTGRRASAGLPC